MCSDLGSHIDGFVATAAHTLVVHSDAEAPVTGREADVLTAAHTALEAAIRLIRPGKRIAEVSRTGPPYSKNETQKHTEK